MVVILVVDTVPAVASANKLAVSPIGNMRLACKICMHDDVVNP